MGINRIKGSLEGSVHVSFERQLSSSIFKSRGREFQNLKPSEIRKVFLKICGNRLKRKTKARRLYSIVIMKNFCF